MITENPIQYGLKSKDISSNEKPRGKMVAELVNEGAQHIIRETGLFQISALLSLVDWLYPQADSLPGHSISRHHIQMQRWPKEKET